MSEPDFDQGSPTQKAAMTRAVQPNFVAGSGEGAVFPGGVTIPISSDAGGSPATGSILWVREADGLLAANDFTYQASLTLEVNRVIRVYDLDGGGATMTIIAGDQIRVLLGEDGSSNFMHVPDPAGQRLITLAGVYSTATGMVWSTGGITITRTGVGIYNLAYPSIFTNTPAVDITPVSQHEVHTPTLGQSAAEARFYTSAGALADSSFSFIIVGPLGLTIP